MRIAGRGGERKSKQIRNGETIAEEERAGISRVGWDECRVQEHRMERIEGWRG